MKKVKSMTDAEFCAYQTQRIRKQLLDLGEFSREACESVHVVPAGNGRFKVHSYNMPAPEAAHLINTLVANGFMTEPVVLAQAKAPTANHEMN